MKPITFTLPAKLVSLWRNLVAVELNIIGQPRLQLIENLTGSATNFADRAGLQIVFPDHGEYLTRFERRVFHVIRRVLLEILACLIHAEFCRGRTCVSAQFFTRKRGRTHRSALLKSDLLSSYQLGSENYSQR